MTRVSVVAWGVLMMSVSATAQEADSSVENGVSPAELEAIETEALSKGLTQQMVEKLSADQLADILRRREERRDESEEDLPQEVIAKLSPEQLVDILKVRAETEAKLEELDAGKSRATEVIVPVAFFLFLGLVIGYRLFIGYRQHGQRQETLRLMVEKGAEIPPELLTETKVRNDLRRGLVLVGAGIALTVVFAVIKTGEQSLWSIGLIPMLIGGGYLLAWKIDPNSRAKKTR